MHGKLNETNVWVLEKNKPPAELRCSVAYFLFFSVFQICGDDNLSKLNTLDKTDTETISAFHFRL